MTTAYSSPQPAPAAPNIYLTLRFKSLGRGHYQACLDRFRYVVEPVAVKSGSLNSRNGFAFVGTVRHISGGVHQTSPKLTTASAAKAWLQHWQQIHAPKFRPVAQRRPTWP